MFLRGRFDGLGPLSGLRECLGGNGKTGGCGRGTFGRCGKGTLGGCGKGTTGGGGRGTFEGGKGTLTGGGGRGGGGPRRRELEDLGLRTNWLASRNRSKSRLFTSLVQSLKKE